jgi:transposase-like protein
MQSLSPREERGKKIAELEGHVKRIDDNTYKVKSQSGYGEYTVIQTELGWICECYDSLYRGSYPSYRGCKHSFAVTFSQKLREVVRQTIVIPSVNLAYCPFCKSKDIIKRGLRHNINGDIQRYGCKLCNREFVRNFAFEKKKAPPQVITAALQLYFSGESLRRTKDFLNLQGVQVSHQTVYNWIENYVDLMQSYVEHIKPNVSEAWRTDEVYLKIKGNKKYLFAVLDDETRFWIAEQVANYKGVSNIRPLFKEAKILTRKEPERITSDGAPNFAVAIHDELPSAKHIADIAFDGIRHNNKMEAMNGQTIRQREKTMRSLKKVNSPILRGLQIYHNFFRPHQALKGKTPAEKAGIRIEGGDKMLTLIQNAEVAKQERDRPKGYFEGI